ncbi:hypothetical protein [Coralloluteibacterium thermophilus]|uniref:Uncharacterized protein n=1 Tax=Coralloluteibacterium thermophilum TaxID=2707049 RepID=A0ABV9NK62_9GAMM
MTRHLLDRRPSRGGVSSWGRSSADGAVLYRLFRRDHTRRVHMQTLGFAAGTPRPAIAAALRAARHQLRDRVDEIDLAALYAQEAA